RRIPLTKATNGRVMVLLTPDNDLPTITISAPTKGKSQRIRLKKHLPVKMCRWGENIVLAYERGGKRLYQLRIFGPGGNLLSQHALEISKLVGMSTTCTDYLYLITKEDAVSFTYENGQLIPRERVPAAQHFHLFAGCHTKVEESYLYEQQLANGLVKNYLLIDTTGKTKLLTAFVDSNLVDSYHEDFRHMTIGWLTDNMGDIGWRENEILRDLQERGDFYLTIMYNNANDNHCRYDDQQIVFFNFDEERIGFFQADGAPRGDQALPVKTDDGFSILQKIIMDPVTKRFYTLAIDRKGHRLYEIDPAREKLIFVDAIETSVIKETIVLNDRWYALGRVEERGMDREMGVFVRLLR
ncbi:MAG: hypothetical protein AAGA31_10805, partial [Bacteroidota bacterium]